jgi:hypothetical protein
MPGSPPSQRTPRDDPRQSVDTRLDLLARDIALLRLEIEQHRQLPHVRSSGASAIEAQVGNVRLRGRAWLLAGLVVLLTAMASAAYVAAEWGPPKRTAPVSDETRAVR